MVYRRDMPPDLTGCKHGRRPGERKLKHARRIREIGAQIVSEPQAPVSFMGLQTVTVFFTVLQFLDAAFGACSQPVVTARLSLCVPAVVEDVHTRIGREATEGCRAACVQDVGKAVRRRSRRKRGGARVEGLGGWALRQSIHAWVNVFVE